MTCGPVGKTCACKKGITIPVHNIIVVRYFLKEDKCLSNLNILG